jgi:hypothetical protein
MKGVLGLRMFGGDSVPVSSRPNLGSGRKLRIGGRNSPIKGWICSSVLPNFFPVKTFLPSVFAKEWGHD